MTAQPEVQFRPWLSRLVAVVVILLVIFVVLINFLRTQPYIEDRLLRVAQQRFLTSVNLAKGQWLMDGRPSRLQWQVPGSDQAAWLSMNAHGWPMAKSGCNQLYSQLMGEAPETLDLDVSEQQVSRVSGAKVCFYSIQAWQLQYHSATGSVILLTRSD
ncbi:hypothetical protein [Ferrimonas aestuarii]|uniref:MSHA biogenesis protein MshF n=1 Tax=Ferrimonas aestuarii TaxID=2569539 RepID=A0A4U1BRR1_9GAMM|nr:hypothetical protein [Ferrimonas aestuarii]TKB55992.1 hypothetical protein FCL42_07170 [Ferrimonas aestuarii]